MPIKPQFKKGDRVKVTGMKAPLIIHWPMIVPVPQIIRGQFELVETIMYKFDMGKNNYFYAYEKDVKGVK